MALSLHWFWVSLPTLPARFLPFKVDPVVSLNCAAPSLRPHYGPSSLPQQAAKSQCLASVPYPLKEASFLDFSLDIKATGSHVHNHPHAALVGGLLHGFTRDRALYTRKCINPLGQGTAYCVRFVDFLQVDCFCVPFIFFLCNMRVESRV